MNTGHLSDETFGDLMAGERPDAATQAHLVQCVPCRTEVAFMRSSLGDFNALSMAWAEAEAPRRVHTPSRWLLRLGGRPAWGMGLAAMAAACILAVGLQRPFERPAPAPAASATPTGPTMAEIAQDNRLMSSIDQELQYSAQPVVPISELKVAREGDRAHSSASVVN